MKPLCIDCGAHAGLISDLMLHCGARVMSFEPNIYLNFFLNKKYAENPDITLFNKAVGAKNYTTHFLKFQGRILSQGNRIVSSVQDEETNKSYKVEVVDLCEFIEKVLKEKNEIFFLKLDVEGVEFEIMEKLLEKGLYKSIKYIVCETHEYMFEDGDSKLQAIKKTIEQHKINNIFLDWV